MVGLVEGTFCSVGKSELEKEQIIGCMGIGFVGRGKEQIGWHRFKEITFRKNRLAA